MVLAWHRRDWIRDSPWGVDPPPKNVHHPSPRKTLLVRVEWVHLTLVIHRTLLLSLDRHPLTVLLAVATFLRGFQLESFTEPWPNPHAHVKTPKLLHTLNPLGRPTTLQDCLALRIDIFKRNRYA
jgi:hypothetical protein